MERVLVPTGLYIQLPDGYEAQIRPRSGLALKKGITVLNSPGTLDADYTGEVGIILINLSNEPFTIKSGERIAQMVISAYSTVQWDNVKYLTNDTPCSPRQRRHSALPAFAVFGASQVFVGRAVALVAIFSSYGTSTLLFLLSSKLRE